VVAVTVLIVAAACTSSRAEPRVIPTTSTLPQPFGEWDGTLPGVGDATLPDPGIPSGDCREVVYTPPTAPTEHEADLCRPAEQRSDVGIILVHGGGGVSGSKEGMFAWSESYLDAGYTTMAVDYTLFEPGQRDPAFPQPEQDLKAAVQYLRGTSRSLGLDPQRIVIQGFSAGARIGAVVYTTGNDPWFAGPTAWPDIADHANALIGLYGTYDGTLQNERTYYGGDADDDDPEVRERWEKANAIENADGAVGPAFLFSGDEDWFELIDQMEALTTELLELGLPARSFVVEGGEHGYDQGQRGLSRLGRETLAQTLFFLDDQFPRD
jgi:acetyl esterase/lipase